MEFSYKRWNLVLVIGVLGTTTDNEML